MNKLTELLDDLSWEYEDMSLHGKKTFNKILKIVGLPMLKNKEDVINEWLEDRKKGS